MTSNSSSLGASGRGPVRLAYFLPLGLLLSFIAALPALIGGEEIVDLLLAGGARALGLVALALGAAVAASWCIALGPARAIAVAASALPWIAAVALGAFGSPADSFELLRITVHGEAGQHALDVGHVLALRTLGSGASLAIFVGAALALFMRAPRDGAPSVAAGLVALAGAGLALASVLEAHALRVVIGHVSDLVMADRLGAPADDVRASIVAGLERAASLPLVGLVAAGVAALAAVGVAAGAGRARGVALRSVLSAALVVPLAPVGDAVLRRGLEEGAGAPAVSPLWARVAGFVPVVLAPAPTADSDALERAFLPAVLDVVVTARGPEHAEPALLAPAAAGSFQAKHGGRPLSVAVDARGHIHPLLVDALWARVRHILLVGAAPAHAPFGVPLVDQLVAPAHEVIDVELSPADTSWCGSVWVIGDAWRLDAEPPAPLVVPGTATAPPARRPTPKVGARACIAVADDTDGARLYAAIRNLHAAGEPAVSIGVSGVGMRRAIDDAIDDATGRAPPVDERRAADRAEAMAALKALGLRGPDAAKQALGGQAWEGGGLDRATIAAAVAAQSDRIRSCYERGLSMNQALAGRVVVEFAFDADGRVPQALVANSSLVGAGARLTERCIVDVIRDIEVAGSGGVVQVTYPFVFESTGADDTGGVKGK